MVPLYIFDLDGTLALIDHRLPLIKRKKPNWDLFFKKCVDDKPNMPVISTCNSLIDAGCDILIFTGRSEIVKKETIEWLDYNIDFECDWSRYLYMSPEGYSIPNADLKKQFYNNLPPRDKKRLIAVFEDQQSTVEMWRDLGIMCFQVVQGDS